MNAKVEDHYNAVAEGYSKQYQRENLETLSYYPANYFRLQILTRRISEARLNSVYEVGVGEGTPLAVMGSMGLRIAGCDIAEAMVNKAKENFRARGLSPELIQWGDIEDATTLANQLKDGPFDSLVAAGVLPHVRNERLMLENAGMMVRNGGRIFIEFRNKLFSLFTFNRYTKEFILDDLLLNVPVAIKNAVAEEIDRRVELQLPPVRDKAGNAPGYDVIRSNFHNPFELLDLFTHCGYKEIGIHWYHYHPAPPMLADRIGSAFRKAAMSLEHEGSWRGWFLCSAGVIEAVKV